MRLLLIGFVVIIIYFGVRGTYAFWSVSGASACPSRPWMSNPSFLCNNARVTPGAFYEPFALFRVLTLDCTLPPPTDMSLILELCCASVQVQFQQIQFSQIVYENGTLVQIPNVDMTLIMSELKPLVCGRNQCNNATCN